jgi:hypothetical protein
MWNYANKLCKFFLTLSFDCLLQGRDMVPAGISTPHRYKDWRTLSRQFTGHTLPIRYVLTGLPVNTEK